MTLVKDNSVQAINTALLSVKRDISALTATKSTCEPSGNPSSGSTDETTAGIEPGKTYNINISGNAATATRATSATSATTADKATTATTAETATKVANALTVNGKTYDGSEAVDAGVQTVANGGTGATDAASGFNALADGVRDSSTPRDDEKMLLKPSGTWYKTTCLDFWNYIKDKISSVLGLTASSYSNVQIGGAGVTGSKLTIQGNAVGSNSYTDANPKLEFKNDDGSQNISLTFTDADAVQAPASLTLNGNQGNEYFIAPNIKANGNITLNSSNGATLAAYGSEPLSIGYPSGTGDGQSLGFDRNSLQARKNGETSALYLNYYGGIVSVNAQNKSGGGLNVKNKMVIPIGAPSSLEDGCIWIER